MKNFFILLSFVICPVITFGQNMSKADRLFKAKQWASAYEIYDQFLQDSMDIEILKKRAYCGLNSMSGKWVTPARAQSVINDYSKLINVDQKYYKHRGMTYYWTAMLYENIDASQAMKFYQKAQIDLLTTPIQSQQVEEYLHLTKISIASLSKSK